MYRQIEKERMQRKQSKQNCRRNFGTVISLSKKGENNNNNKLT